MIYMWFTKLIIMQLFKRKYTMDQDCYSNYILLLHNLFNSTYMLNVYKRQLSRQTGSRNLTGQKTLPTKWGTYMKLVTKYQISAINICWGKWAYMFNVYKNQPYMHIFRRIFLSNYWWQESDIWSQASYRY
jgi:hypothetical protein